MTNEALNDCLHQFEEWQKEYKWPIYDGLTASDVFAAYSAAWNSQQKKIDELVKDLTGGCPT